MANTTLFDGNIITITGLDADWNAATESKTSHRPFLKVQAIQFIPSAASDRMIIHDNGIDAIDIFDSGTVTDANDSRIQYYDPPLICNPVIDISDCTFGTAGNCKVKIFLS